MNEMDTEGGTNLSNELVSIDRVHTNIFISDR
jgi:hypothetical protein